MHRLFVLSLFLMLLSGGESISLLDPSRAVVSEMDSQLSASSLNLDAISCRMPGRDMDAAPVPAYCFAPGTPSDVKSYYENLMHTDPNGARYFLAGRWPGTQGSPLTLTWSFVPDGLSINGEPSELFTRMDSLFGGDRALWISLFEQAFARWSELTGLSYQRITYGGNDWDDGDYLFASASSTRGHVRIGMIPIDGPNSVLAYNYYPSYGDMVLDRSEDWADDAYNYRFLRDVVMHEHGHGIGLEHVCSQGTIQLMEPELNKSIDGPQHDDIRAGQRHYGDPFEPDNDPSSANDIGVLASGDRLDVGILPDPVVANTSRLSIDANGESDYFIFATADENQYVTIAVIPQGFTYDSSSQNGDGTCNSGNFVDSTSMANLAVELRDADGVTVLATASSAASGNPEIIEGLLLPDAGNYYIRVYETAYVSQSQLYILSVDVDDADCDDDGLLDVCAIDCSSPGCNLPGCGESNDCNTNGIPDECDTDCNSNGWADECEIALLIEQQPTDQGGDCTGQHTATFSVTAPAATGFQWLKNSVPLSDGGTVQGVGTSVLTITDYVAGDFGTYSCVVSEGCLVTETEPAVLSGVVTAEIVVAPPSSVFLCDGNTALLAVQAIGEEPLEYQWTRNGLPLADDSHVAGSSTHSLTINDFGEDDVDVYSCTVSNECGEETSSATAIELEIDFVNHPVDACAEVGEAVELNVEATSAVSPGLSFYWRKDGEYLADGGNISGSYSETLLIDPVSESDAGFYDVTVVSQGCITNSRTAELSVGNCLVCSNPGDMDSDSDYDLADLYLFTACYGADLVGFPQCLCGDVVADGTIDADDWAALSSLLAGPQ